MKDVMRYLCMKMLSITMEQAGRELILEMFWFVLLEQATLMSDHKPLS